MGERATVSPAAEVIEWHNVVLGEHGTTRDVIGVSVPKCTTERSEWMLKWVQWIECMTEHSELEGSRAQASVNKRAQRDTLQCERSELIYSFLTRSLAVGQSEPRERSEHLNKSARSAHTRRSLAISRDKREIFFGQPG